MKLSPLAMGKHFGELAYLRGIITYKISHFEQRAFGGFLKSIPRTAYRIRSNLLTIVPPVIVGYLIYTETEKKFEQMCRKNPQDYVNDK